MFYFDFLFRFSISIIKMLQIIWFLTLRAAVPPHRFSTMYPDVAGRLKIKTTQKQNINATFAWSGLFVRPSCFVTSEFTPARSPTSAKHVNSASFVRIIWYPINGRTRPRCLPAPSAHSRQLATIPSNATSRNIQTHSANKYTVSV